MRRSSRPRARPTEFWNFEKPDYSMSQDLSYDLTKLSQIYSLNLTLSKEKIKRRKLSDDSETTLNINKKKRTSSPSVRESTNFLKRQSSLPKKVAGQRSKTATQGISTSTSIVSKVAKPIVLESNDSGVTDLDGSCSQSTALDSRQMEPPSDTSSNRHEPIVNSAFKMGSTFIQPTVDNENSYSLSRKALTFKDAVSSTGIDEEDTNECFKVPAPLFKATAKKALAIEPTLCSILEENENETSRVHDSTLDITPKKRDTSPKSRNLNLSFAAELEAGDEIENGKGIQNDLPKQKRNENCKKSSRKLLGELNSDADAAADLSINNNTDRRQLKKSSTKENVTCMDSINSVKNNAMTSTGSSLKSLIGKRNLRSRTEKNVTGLEDECSMSSIQGRKLPKQNMGQRTTLPEENDTTMVNTSVHTVYRNESSTVRRSSRLRTKPLEFWNFEKAEVKKQGNGELSVVYKKLEEKNLIHSRLVNTSISREPSNKSKSYVTDRPALTKNMEGKRSRKAIFSTPRTSLADKINDEDSESSQEVTLYKSLYFREWTTEEFKCYLARNYCNKSQGVFAGFLFLETGKMVWETSKETTLFVIFGEGTLKVLDKKSNGKEIILVEEVQTIVPVGNKVCLEVEKDCAMLRLFLVLKDSTT